MCGSPDPENQNDTDPLPKFATRSPLRLNWMQGKGNAWYRLSDLDLAGVRDIGVFVIWHAGDAARWVKVGQGHIADCLEAQRSDPAIARFQHLGLHVTWAAVSVDQVNGVEAYLGAICRPLVGDRFPNVVPIPVNLPGVAVRSFAEQDPQSGP
jgi:hypothetical protein